jgi:hypothetical protein
MRLPGSNVLVTLILGTSTLVGVVNAAPIATPYTEASTKHNHSNTGKVLGWTAAGVVGIGGTLMAVPGTRKAIMNIPKMSKESFLESYRNNVGTSRKIQRSGEEGDSTAGSGGSETGRAGEGPLEEAGARLEGAACDVVV